MIRVVVVDDHAMVRTGLAALLEASDDVTVVGQAADGREAKAVVLDTLPEQAYDDILSHDCIPLTRGGDHTIVLPILRAIRRKYGPVALVHVDAYADVNDEMSG